jgi:hypothetical protein
LENINESYLSNVLTMEEYDTFPTNVPIPYRRKMMKKFTTKKTNTRRNFIRKKKKIYSKEDIKSSYISEDADSYILLMGMKTQNDKHSEEEKQGNFEEQILSVIEELGKIKKQNRVLRRELLEINEAIKSREREVSKTLKESEQTISDLNSQLLETNKIEEIILKQLSDKKQACEKLEADITLLKNELEKEKKRSNFGNSSKILDEIISSQRSPNNKTGLGYIQDSTSTSQGSVKRPISYADALKGPLRREYNK